MVRTLQYRQAPLACCLLLDALCDKVSNRVPDESKHLMFEHVNTDYSI